MQGQRPAVTALNRMVHAQRVEWMKIRAYAGSAYNKVVRFFSLLLIATFLFARSSIERLEPEHLQAVHAQRVEWMKIRAHAAPAAGVYQDYRALLHIHAEDADHTKGTRA